MTTPVIAPGGMWVYRPETGDWYYEPNEGPGGEWVENPATGDMVWTLTDNTSTPVTITSPSEGATVAGDVPVEGTAGPHRGVALSVSGDSKSPYTRAADADGRFYFDGNGVLPDGDWTFTVADGITTDSVSVHVGEPEPEPDPPPEEAT